MNTTFCNPVVPINFNDCSNSFLQPLRRLLFGTSFALILGFATNGWAQTTTPVSLVIQNNTGVSSSQIYLQFLGGGTVSGSFTDSATGATVILQQNTSYSLAQLQSGTMDLSKYSGRIYVNYGAYGLANLGADNGGYTPAASLSTDPNYNTRYQYFETTITPQSDGSSTFYGDLSYIDFTAMSMSMKAINTTTGAIQTSVSNSDQISANTQILVNATTGAASNANLAVFPLGASTTLPNSAFTRVISPQFSATGTYHDFSSYLDYLGATTTGSISAGGTAILPGAQSVNIAGVFVGTGMQPSGTFATQAQTYDYTGTFNESGGIVLTANPIDSGIATGIPGISPKSDGTGVGGNVTISISGAALNQQSGIYGNNVAYTITTPSGSYTTDGITNDVYGRIVGDLLAGLSFGYVGSTGSFTLSGSLTTGNGTFTTTTLTTSLGALPSSAWWASGEAQGTALTYIPQVSGTTVTYLAVTYGDTPSSSGDYFSQAQSNPDFYDGYAASLGGTTVLTTGYGFPLQDRLGNNLLSYNTIQQPGTQVVIVLNPDGNAPILTGIWTGTQTGSTTTSDWNTAGNWRVNGSGTGGTMFTNGVPPSGATVQFQGTGTGTSAFTVNTAVTQTVNGISFNYGADTFTLTGSTIYLSGNIVNSSHNTQTIQNDLEFDTNSNVVAAYGNLALGNINLTGTTVAIFAGDYGSTVNGTISGSGAVIMTGAGSQTINGINPLTVNGTNTLTLNGANTFSGGLFHQGGTLILGNDSAAGTGTFTVGNTMGGLAILQAGGGSHTLANDVSLIGNVTVSGTYGLTFTGNTTLTGTVGGPAFVVTNTAPVNFGGAIGENTPGQSFTKSGTGTMTFSGSSANTFSGSLAVSQGTLVLNKDPNVQAYAGNLTIGTGLGTTNSAIVQIDASSQLPASQSITINTDGQLNLQSFDASTSSLIMTGGSIIGSGSLLISSTGTSGGSFLFTGIKASTGTISSGVQIAGQETFQIGKTLATGPEVTISGPLTGDGSVTPISLTKTGSGILALTGSNSVTGTVSISVVGGVLETTSIANANITLNNGALGSTSTGTVGAAIQVQTLNVNNGAFILGLGTGGTSDTVNVTGNVSLSTTMGSTPTFFFQNDGFTSGTGSFTVLEGGAFIGTPDLSNLQYASLGIAGLTGTFVMSGNNLMFVGQAGVTGTWTGGGGSGAWGTGGNWQSGTVPVSGADLTFTGNTQTSVSTGTNQTTGAITFDSSAGAITISGNTITLGGNLTNNSTGTQTITSNITLNASRTFAANNGDLVLTGSIILSNSGAMPGTLTFTGSQNISASGDISDGTYVTGTVNNISGGSVVMAGTGTLTLTGNNSFDGDLVLNSGTVSGSQDTAFGEQVSSSGNYVAANSIVFNGGTLQITNSMTFSQFRGISMYQTGIIDTDGNNLLVEGVISGPGGLIKNGAGALTLNQTGTATNSYQGATVINGGSIVMGYVGALGNTTAGVTVNNGGSLVINQSMNIAGEAITLSGTGDTGNGALHLVTGLTSTWGGPITLAADASIQADLNATLNLTGSINVGANTLIITGTGTSASSAVNLIGSVTGTGGISKYGSNFLNITGANSGFNGAVNIQQGIVTASQGSSLGGGTGALTVANGASLQFTNTTDMSVGFNSINLGGSGADGNGAIVNENSGVTTVAGSITLQGTTTLGTLGGQLVFTGDIDTAGNVLTVDSKAAQTVLSGAISGSGGIATAGTSSVLLSGTSSYTGGTSVANTTAVVVGSSQGLGSAAGTTTVVSGGSLEFQGGINVSQNISAVGTGVTNNGVLENLSGTNSIVGTVTLQGVSTLQSDAGKLSIGTLTANGPTDLAIQGYGTISLTGSVSNISNITVTSGVLAASNLTGVNLNIGQGVAYTGGSAPSFSPGDLNNIQNVNVTSISTAIGAQFLMDLTGSTTSDEITAANAPGLSGTLAFYFNNDGGVASSGTYTLIHTTSGGNIAFMADASFATNIVGLSGTFELSADQKSLLFIASTNPTVWNNANSSGVWGDAGNWQNGYTPADGSAVTFTGTTTTAIDTQMDRLAGGITFQSGSAGLTINNHTINLYGQIVNNSTTGQAITSALHLAGDTSANAASGDLTLVGAIDLGAYSSTPLFTVTGSHNTSISGGISSGVGITGTLVKSGTGSLHLTGTNTFAGSTQINGGNLILDGTTSASNTIMVNSGGTLSGTGTALGKVFVGSGGTLSPGHSPGTLNTGSEVWMPGGNLNWQLADATGAAGTGYDSMNITGTLDLGALTNASFSINLWTLSSTGPDVNGPALNFDGTTNYSWVLASTTSGVTGFDPSLFDINTTSNNGTSGFANTFGGDFSLSVSGNNLVLNYNAVAVPEPSTWALLLVSMTGLLLLARRGAERGARALILASRSVRQPDQTASRRT